MSQQGLMGITIPEADGGQGGALMDAVIAIEQVATACPRSADVVQFGNFGPIRTFAEYGTDYQKKRWLEPCLKGEAVMSLGMSEPDAGSAVTDLKTSAKPDGNELRPQRHQGVLDLQPGRRRVPGLCALRAGRRRHRLGAGRARARRASPSARRRSS